MDQNSSRTGNMAIRSGSFLHIDEEIETAYNEEYKQLHPEEDESLRETRNVANLESHPGWKIVRRHALERIEQYRSGRVVSEYLANYSLTDEQIGQLTRNMNLIAGELTAFLNEVTLAVGEVERQKGEARETTRTRMGSRATPENK